MTLPQKQHPIYAAVLMVLAGSCFAAVNVSIQSATMTFSMPSVSVVFWQYATALLFAVPWIIRQGSKKLRTRNWRLHCLRICFAVVGVQLWGAGLAQVPIWQAIALVMTSPFFVIIGAKLFLGERVGLPRALATLTGFAGAMIILEPWSDKFVMATLYPISAAAFWAGVSVITKRLTASESNDTITVYMLLLLTPVNLALALGEGLALPSNGAEIAVIAATGLFTVAANYFLTVAYSKADATYIQPFDHLKLIMNVIGGWLVFSYAPPGFFWGGAIIIVGASLYVVHNEGHESLLGEALDDELERALD
ncbi:MAG: DMT family transporter [Rhodobacteraceae bacterium]|nr:DMT family transporter [Paracoccaceae bacterium]